MCLCHEKLQKMKGKKVCIHRIYYKKTTIAAISENKLTCKFSNSNWFSETFTITRSVKQLRKGSCSLWCGLFLFTDPDSDSNPIPVVGSYDWNQNLILTVQCENFYIVQCSHFKFWFAVQIRIGISIRIRQCK